jgi:hypothetical protein
MSGSSLAQKVMPIIGAFYVLIGLLGFTVTGFNAFLANTDDALFGFSLNPLHNVVHIAIGGFLIIMSRQTTSMAEGACLGVGLFYVTAFVIGVIGESNLTIISMFGRGDLENFNHLVNGGLLLAIGLISTAATESDAKRRGFA